MFRLSIMFIWVFIVLIHSGIAQSDMSVTQMKTEIENVKAQIAEEEKLWAEERNREVQSEQDRKKRYEDFVKEKQELNIAINKVDKEMATALSKIENLKQQRAGLESEFKSYSVVLLDLSQKLEQKLHTSFIYKRDKRAEEVGLLSTDLRTEKISPEEGFTRLWSLYQKEHTMASDAEVFSADVQTQDGQDVSVKYVRVGKQIMAYADPSGTYLGWLRLQDGQEWVWIDEKNMDYDMRQSIRDIIAVAEGKAAPGFVSIPLFMKDFGEVIDITAHTEQDQSATEGTN
jgi:hypothetical protein